MTDNNFELLQGLVNIDVYEKMMEEMANAPKEEYGKRQPGETCAFERIRPPEATEKPAGEFK